MHIARHITSIAGAKYLEATLYVWKFLYGKEVAKSLAYDLSIDWSINTIYPLIVAR